MFLIWGGITTACGILLFFLPGNPLSATLTADEKKGVVDWIKENGTGMENRYLDAFSLWRRSDPKLGFCLSSHSHLTILM